MIADRTRALAVVDPNDRALTISCGAALENLLVAARRFGRNLAIETLSNAADADLLAIVQLECSVTPSSEDIALFEAIPNRVTTRTKYDKRPLPKKLLDLCRDLALRRGVELSVLDDDSRRAAIADLVAEGDRIQFDDPRFRRELAAWVHSRRAVSLPPRYPSRISSHFDR